MASANMPPSSLPQGLTAQNYEAVKRLQELSVKMGFRQDPEFSSLINMFPGQMHPEVTIQPKPAKSPVLRLDAFGMEFDEQGNVVNVPKPSSTLKYLSCLNILNNMFESNSKSNLGVINLLADKMDSYIYDIIFFNNIKLLNTNVD
ncbi:hypothetical protein RND71_028894 [Anisodus tanguticus]|uniref:Uncharacterized protein n=1 Tax=Anisodus tanguticus TaxID=243964 RepID=A0AAE1RLT8_9SOLA|nr:hypothetical protein RND71_028894 [Anisodus tanguticus]